jgi:hypothetical protein
MGEVGWARGREEEGGGGGEECSPRWPRVLGERLQAKSDVIKQRRSDQVSGSYALHRVTALI